MKGAGAALAAMALLASCAPRPAPPAPVPVPPPARPPPQAPPPPPPPPEDWRDRPVSPGDWTYNGESAAFTSRGGPLFELRCALGGQIVVVRLGVPAGPITIVTSFGERALPTSSNNGPTIATLPASDPLLDQIVFSRGRFLVRAAGGDDLVLPSWPEPARMIEECRAQ